MPNLLRDVDHFLTEPGEKFFDAIKAYDATSLVSCRVAMEGSSKLQDKWSDGLIFSMIIPLSKSSRVKKCLTLFALKSRFAAA